MRGSTSGNMQIVSNFATYMRQFVAYNRLGNELPEICLVYGGLKVQLGLTESHSNSDHRRYVAISGVLEMFSCQQATTDHLETCKCSRCTVTHWYTCV